MARPFRRVLLLFSLALFACQDNERSEITSPTTAPAGTRTAVPSATAPVATATPTPLATDPTSAASPTPPAAPAADADVTFVRAVKEDEDAWTFHVTIAHPDTGWDDYVDGWDVVLPDGSVLRPNPGELFTRVLLHPHVNEQPFTRSQSNIQIPDGVTRVTVRAHDLVDGFGGREVDVDLTVASGPDFTVELTP